MRKTLRDTVNFTFGRNRISSLWFSKRPLSIKSTEHIVTDSSHAVCSIILPTSNDEEKYPDKMSYHKASMCDLASAIPNSMKGKDLLLLKVNQCVIDYDDYAKFDKITPHLLGHVISWIVRVVDNSLVILEDSLVSKVQKFDRYGNQTLNTLES